MSNKLIIKGISISYLKQVVALLIGIFSLPLMLNYFGVQLYGIWILILGLTTYINNIAFGIPNAMITLVAKTTDLQDKELILKKSLVLLTIIVIVTLIIFFIVINHSDDWIVKILGNIDNEYLQITKKIFIIFIIATLIRIPLSLFIHFFTGMNLVYISQIYELLTLVFGFSAILITIYFKLDMVMLILITMFFYTLINIISIFHFFIKFKYLKIENIKKEGTTYSKILESAFSFFQIGLAVSLVWNTDNLIISHFLSTENVTYYSIAFKIFTYIFIFSFILNGVMGPIYGTLYAVYDWNKIKKYISIMLKFLPVIGGLVWFFLLFFSKELISLWTNNENSFGGYLLIFSLGLYGYILSYVTTYSTLVFSLNFANKALKIAWSEALINLILSIIFVKYLGIGGVALGTALASLFTGFIFFPRLIQKITENNIIIEYGYAKKHFFLLILPGVFLSILSIFLEYFLIKLIFFIIMILIYFFYSWNFLLVSDKNELKNIFNKYTIGV